MRKIYKFSADFGRMGWISSIFSAEEEDINITIGKEIYFGEVLGKHSEICFILNKSHLEEITSNQEFIKTFDMLCCSTGMNPIHYVNEEVEEKILD